MVRTRFAPSPTGFLHVGGLRTALYNFLFARKYDGRFILRIEDTDQRRKVAGAVENLLQTLDWAGLKPDEGPQIGGDFGPYIQSERLQLYRKYAQELLEKGDAYYCFCSSERLKKLKEWQVAQKIPPRYDNHCRNLSAEEIQRHLYVGEKYVIRMKVPDAGSIEIDDLIRGKVTFPVSQIDDQVLLKSDGYPTYHLANVVDDHLMQISHVIRGEEWLPSTPKHVLLYGYFGWELPQFAHLSLLLNPDKSKLSKRQGDVAVEDYRRKGYLPEALINFLALLGWNPGDDREIFSLDELVHEFSLERVSRSGAIFNIEKLNWMNGIYIRSLSPERLWNYAKPYLEECLHQSGVDEGKHWDEARLKAVLNSVKDGLSNLSEIPQKTAFYFASSIAYEAPEIQEYLTTPESVAVLKTLIPLIDSAKLCETGRTESDFGSDSFIAAVRNVQKATGIKGKPLWMTLRVALTGTTQGPEIHQIAGIIGLETCKKRLEAALNYAENHLN
ncbi:MAG TPA: glutamate--tRNA ligase [Candidatus Marinimicrobia bacterium]|nr:glutamate--tRNA ligase [Candidatus Neomarinimicrobiota bacterium]HRS51787.1 glutamate--tRNA ligase [Candidatus Neomarinimicrobiota bacterium]HRU93057.1 glutamate--tRNA ligase [Candidatus Neomarinimicrobiota bacterium]